jgi:hypothetical protein
VFFGPPFGSSAYSQSASSRRVMPYGRRAPLPPRHTRLRRQRLTTVWTYATHWSESS